MKKLLIFFLVFSLLGAGIPTAHAKSVRGYIKKSGTYVAPHQRTNKNSTRIDNYSTRGNTNPFTGKKGYKSPIKPFKFR